MIEITIKDLNDIMSEIAQAYAHPNVFAYEHFHNRFYGKIPSETFQHAMALISNALNYDRENN